MGRIDGIEIKQPGAFDRDHLRPVEMAELSFEMLGRGVGADGQDRHPALELGRPAFEGAVEGADFAITIKVRVLRYDERIGLGQGQRPGIYRLRSIRRRHGAHPVSYMAKG